MSRTKDGIRHMQRKHSRIVPGLVLAALLLVSVTLIMSCSKASSDSKIRQISVAQLDSLLAQDSTLKLIDVRTLTEYNTVHVPHVKVRIDFQEIADVIDTVAFPKDQPVYLICRTGRRSLIAAKALRDFGYQDPINVSGGTTAWVNSGYPVIKP